MNLLNSAIIDNDRNKIINLVENGFPLNYQNNNDKMTPLMWATTWGDFELVKYLVENGSDINLQDINNENALFMSCGMDVKLNIVRYLVENGADKNLRDNKNRTPLQKAQKWGATETINYLNSLQ